MYCMYGVYLPKLQYAAVTYIRLRDNMNMLRLSVKIILVNYYLTFHSQFNHDFATLCVCFS